MSGGLWKAKGGGDDMLTVGFLLEKDKLSRGADGMERWVGVDSVEVVVAVLATMLMGFRGGAEMYCVGWRRAGGRGQTG